MLCLFSLLTDIHHYEVIVCEVSEDGGGPTIGVATCSPLTLRQPAQFLMIILSGIQMESVSKY
jgi:hypothetical protein